MPLTQGKSKKTFQKNLKTELEHGKPMDQSLAISYSIKRKNARKKMAEGGMAYKNDSAKTEARPMPSEVDSDKEMVSKNSGVKAPSQDQWTDRPDMKQSTKGPKTTRIKHPSMVPSSAFSTRMRDEEDDLQSSASTNNGPQRQPPEHDNEEGPNRQGPKVSDMQDEHSTSRKPYAKGGEVKDKSTEQMYIEHLDKQLNARRKYSKANPHLSDQEVNAASTKDLAPHMPKSKYAKGGEVEEDLHHSPAGGSSNRSKNAARIRNEEQQKGVGKGGTYDPGMSEAGYSTRGGLNEQAKNQHDKTIRESRKINPKLKGLAEGGKVEASDYDHSLDGAYEDDLLDIPPSEDMGESMAESHNEESPDRQGPESEDLHMKMMAEGGEAESIEDHEDSLIAAIMAKRSRMLSDEDGMSGSHDMNEAQRMALGGEILEEGDDIHSHGSMDTHESADQADLSRNADEDANEEDQASFNALRKENYSETPGLDELDSPEDSNEHGHELSDEDEHSMIESIRNKMNQRRQFKSR